MSTAVQPIPAQLIRDLLASPQVTSAFDYFDTFADAITEEQIRICSLPASTFKEQERAYYLKV